MTPTIVLKDGKPFLVTGSPGGSRIITTVLQVISNVIDRGMPIAEAVSAPRVHNQWMPEEVFVEPGVTADLLRASKLAATRSGAAAARHVGQLDPGDTARAGRRRRSPHPRRAGCGALITASAT